MYPNIFYCKISTYYLVLYFMLRELYTLFIAIVEINRMSPDFSFAVTDKNVLCELMRNEILLCIDVFIVVRKATSRSTAK